MKRNIVYISGTRADFGLMRRSLQLLALKSNLSVSVLVTGMHLAPEFGDTWQEIELAGLTISRRIPIDATTRTRESMSTSLGQAISGMTQALHALRPDAVVVLGDRGEMLAAAIVCLHLGIPVFHIHGGERSGTIDEPMRHAISKLATWHLVTTPASRDRLIRMGEREDTITVVGAPGLDGLCELAGEDAAGLMIRLQLDPEQAFALVLFHPVVQQAEMASLQTLALVDAMVQTGLQLMWLAPNSDAGSVAIAEQVQQRLVANSRAAYVVHLERADFATAMRHCAVMVGNSSAGIIEAATFGTPVVNIGVRQHLRERNANVHDCGIEQDQIAAAIDLALAHGRRPFDNVYRQGNAAELIAQLLVNTPLEPAALLKVNSY